MFWFYTVGRIYLHCHVRRKYESLLIVILIASFRINDLIDVVNCRVTTAKIPKCTINRAQE